MSFMKQVATLSIVAILLTLVPVQTAEAAGPPVAELVADERSQEGIVKAFCWNENPVMQQCRRQNFYVFPKRTLAIDGPTSIIIEKPEPPDTVEVRYWTRIRRDRAGSLWFDTPRGKARTIEVTLEPLTGADGVRWAATFDAPDARRVYISATATWSAEAMCPTCEQWVTWAFSGR